MEEKTQLMKIYFQRPNTGSRWFFGNFSLGIMVDAHPRFVNVIFAALFVEMVIAWERQNDQSLARRASDSE